RTLSSVALPRTLPRSFPGWRGSWPSSASASDAPGLTEHGSCPSTPRNESPLCKRAWPRSGGIFDLDRKRSRIALIDRDAGQPDFWNDQVKAQGLLKEKAGLQAQVEAFERVERALEDARTLLDLAAEAGDDGARAQAAGSL